MVAGVIYIYTAILFSKFNLDSDLHLALSVNPVVVLTSSRRAWARDSFKNLEVLHSTTRR